MCGIVGLHTSQSLDLTLTIQNMRDTLTHRGPDASGSRVFTDDQLALGHRRLSILDLSSAGTQPFSSDDGNHIMVFNGEIYNFRELRDQLVTKGHSFRTGTDTEVLIHAYQVWGSEMVHKIEGMFAFAIFDKKEKTLFCARDRSGEKPFFYFRQSDTFAFSSETKGLFALKQCPRKIDYLSLQQFLAFGYTIGNRSMVDGIYKLPPGHSLTYSLKTRDLTIDRYWEPAGLNSRKSKTPSEYAEDLHALLKASLRKQLVADVPVGILLSGGVDSSIIAAVASEISNKRLHTFTAVFPGAGTFDESPYAKLVADHLGTEHTELVIEPSSVEILYKLAKQFDEPIADSSMIPTHLVSSLIRQHATVALGGDGADELFGGYPHHRWLAQLEYYRQFLPSYIRKPLRSAVELAIPVGTKGRNYLLAALSDSSMAMSKFNLYFNKNNQDKLLTKSTLEKIQMLNGSQILDRSESHTLGLSMEMNPPLLDFLTYLPDDILTKVDRSSMLTSLEVRAPWLDPAIIDFSFQEIPLHMKGNRASVKMIPKALASKLLPKSLDINRKQGFSLPLESWFTSRWGELMTDTLLQSDQTIFRHDAVKNLLKRQASGAQNMQRLFALTMFTLWLKTYDIEP